MKGPNSEGRKKRKRKVFPKPYGP